MPQLNNESVGISISGIALVLASFICLVVATPTSAVERLVVPDVKFLAEKTGVMESRVEAELIPTLRSDPSVERAYLVLVQYPQNQLGVALCIAGSVGNKDGLSASVESTFKAIAAKGVSLDIMFITMEQERHGVSSVAQPFYGPPLPRE